MGSTKRYVLLFALYGIYAAASEGISKAWISNISKEKTATAIGNYSAFQIFAGQFLGRILFSISG
jgi:hypothetical protein